jgi:hypothetical protein
MEKTFDNSMLVGNQLSKCLELEVSKQPAKENAHQSFQLRQPTETNFPLLLASSHPFGRRAQARVSAPKGQNGYFLVILNTSKISARLTEDC